MEYTHGQYEDCMPKWVRAREVVAGEDTVKAAGVKYLPKLDGMSETDYAAYKARAKYMNATGRTLDGLQGMVFRKEPDLKLPEAGQSFADEMDRIRKDTDLKGNDTTAYSRLTVREVLTVARGGTLVDYNAEEKRPYMAFYRAEDIWNWRVRYVNGKSVLDMVALHECRETPVADDGSVQKPGEIRSMQQTITERLLVCKLAAPVGGTVPVYQIEVWELVEREAGKTTTKQWELKETKMPVRRGTALNFIPFYFHSPDGSMSDCCKLPLEDLISVNLHHYRVSADYSHGLHFTALPVPWAAGFDVKQELKIGSSVAWVTDNKDAKVGFLEFTGQGLNALKEAIEDDKKDMVILGARLIETHKKDAEAAETVKLRQSGESSVLTDVARSVSHSLTMALRAAYWWLSNDVLPENVEEESATITLNTDYFETILAAEDLNALVAAWISGAISHLTLLENLRRGEILPKERTNEEEMDLIKETGPPMPPMPAAGAARGGAAGGAAGGGAQ